MPSFPPRNEPRKKKEELDLKRHILENAILNNLSAVILNKKGEIYKTAKISYNKAILHSIREKEWQNKKHSFDKEKVMNEVEVWEKKSIKTIIDEIKNSLK